MPRKAKKKVHKMPPLSLVDKIIYRVLFVTLWTVTFALFLAPIILGDKIIFADEMVIAGENSFLWASIPFFVCLIFTCSFWEKYYQGRQPIFGLRNFKYGPPGWPKVYPLFMKNKPYVWVSEKQKKSRKQIAVILTVILLLSFVPYPWSFYGRECLYSNGSIVQYNGFNVPVREFSSGEIAEVEFKAYKHGSGKYVRTWHYDVLIKLTTDSGKKYTFEFHNFPKNEAGETPYWLTAMLQLKSRYSPEIITYSGIEYLRDVVSDNGLTEEETRLLYQLFDQELIGETL